MRRAIAHFESRATPVLISTMIVLLLLGFARIYTVTQTLQRQQSQTCHLRYAGRASENAQVRIPLRGSLTYLADVVLAGARMQPDVAKRAATIAFARKYLAYAGAIEILPNPRC